MNEKTPIMIELSDVSQIDVKVVGGKASNLRKLIQNHINVPDGYIITTKAYELFLSLNNLKNYIKDILSEIDYSDFNSIEKASKKIRDEILRKPLPNELIKEIKENCYQYENYSVAVRSSAVAEDLPHASFAGQYDSYLNLKGQEEIVGCVKRCYASLWTSRSVSYRYKNKIPQENLRIAVIVQNMIMAKCSGVLFTANPISLNVSEMIVESNFGLGESVVSGMTSPDQYTIQRKGKHGKESFEIITRRIGNKKIVVQPKASSTESGTDYKELSEQESEKPSISDESIIKLVEIGTFIEYIFKNPQDIEWAIDANDQIFILQSRPIVTTKARDFRDSVMPLFSRGYSDDYWNDNTTPLFFDLLGDPITKIVNLELNNIMGYKKMSEQLLKLYQGYVFFNLDVIKRKVEYEIPTFMRSIDVLSYFPEGSGPYGRKSMKDLPFRLLRRLFSEIRIRFHDPDGAMSKTDVIYQKWTDEIFNHYCDSFDVKLKHLKGSNDLESLLNLSLELDSVMTKHFRLIRYGIPVHNLGMSLMTKYLLTRFLGEKDSQNYYPILISGLKNKLTETNERIHHLGVYIQKSELLRKIFKQKNSKEIFNYLSNEDNQEIRIFLKEFQNFLKEYGDRGYTREPFYPRWRESPELVLDILKSISTEKWETLENLKTKNLMKRKHTEIEVEKKIRAQKFGLLKWILFSIILKNSRKYIKFREDQRFNLDRWITRHRKIFLEIGTILVDRKILQENNEIFFLYKNEIRKIIKGYYNEAELKKLSEMVKKRYSEFLKYEHTIPPKFLQSGREFNDILEFGYDSTYFYGIAASQGKVSAPARVLSKISLIPTVQSGEILIVPKTDPGWTPVFSKIGGLITETGGILSHGAVVSREYGIPAVTNIPNACKIFKTGQILLIDGFNGKVTLKKK